MHKRATGGVSGDTSRIATAEDAASGQKRPPDGELWRKMRVKVAAASVGAFGFRKGVAHV